MLYLILPLDSGSAALPRAMERERIERERDETWKCDVSAGRLSDVIHKVLSGDGT